MNDRGTMKYVDYAQALSNDDPALMSEGLRFYMEQHVNPLVNVLDVFQSCKTLAHTELIRGNFNLATYFLLDEEGNFRNGCDPCFIGYYPSEKTAFENDSDAVDSVMCYLDSAGAIFFLAQMIYRYAKKHDRELFDGLMSGKANFFDVLYWTQDNGVRRDIPSTNNKITGYRRHNLLMEKIAKAVVIHWERAVFVAEREEVVANSLTPLGVRQHWQNILADQYVKLAMEELAQPQAAYWLLQKAYVHLKLAGNTEKQATLLAYFNLEDNEKTRPDIRFSKFFYDQVEALEKEVKLGPTEFLSPGDEKFILTREALLADLGISAAVTQTLSSRSDSPNTVEARHSASEQDGLRRRALTSASAATTFGGVSPDCADPHVTTSRKPSVWK